MKKVFICLAIVIASIAFVAQKSHAVATDTITITISINATSSVLLDNNTWNLSGSSFNTSYATGPFTISNDGNVYSDIMIQGSDSNGTNPWSISATTGLNQFVLQALIGSDGASAPAASDFGNDGTDTLTTSYITATAADLGEATWDATPGTTVAPGSARDLFLYLSTPTSGWTSAVSIGSIVVNVSSNPL